MFYGLIVNVGSDFLTLVSQSVRIPPGAKEGRAGYEAGDATRGARHVALLQKVDRADAILKMHTLRGARALANDWPDVVETRYFYTLHLHQPFNLILQHYQFTNTTL